MGRKKERKDEARRRRRREIESKEEKQSRNMIHAIEERKCTNINQSTNQGIDKTVI